MNNDWRINVVLFFIAVVIAFTTAHIVGRKQPTTQAYPIIDKYEIKDKHYIAVEVEVSPEEYIGYEVGDDYAD